MKFVKAMAKDTWARVLDLIYRVCMLFVDWYYDFVHRNCL